MHPTELGTGRLVSLPDADLYVYEQGPPDGEPMVLLHGFMTSAFTWRRVVPGLAQEHRVILVDLPGSGRSPDPRATAWSADRFADLLARLMDSLSLPAPTLVGSQMGGSLAAWFGARYPHRVSRLVVMAAGVLGEAKTNDTLYRLLANRLTGSWLARRFPRAKFEERWRAAHGPHHVHDSAAIGYYFEQLRARGNVIAKVGLGIRMSYGESFDALSHLIRGLEVPTLLIFGEADRLVPPATARRFEELLVNAELVVLPGCGDFPQEERPDEVTAEILKFVAARA